MIKQGGQLRIGYGNADGLFKIRAAEIGEIDIEFVPLHVISLSLDALHFDLAQCFWFDRGTGAICLSFYVGDAELLLQLIRLLLQFFDHLVLLAKLLFECGNAFPGGLKPLVDASNFIDFGNFIGDDRGFIFILADDSNFDQAGIARLMHVGHALQNGVGQVSRKLIDLHFLRPFPVKVQVGDDLIKDQLGLNRLELSLNPVRIET